MDQYEPFGGGTTTDAGGASPVAGEPASAPFLSLGGDSSGTDSGGFDPAIHVSPDKRNRDGSYTRKRGRKAGGTSNSASGGNRGRSKAQDYSASLDAFTGMLAIVHVGLASATKTPELVLEDDDAKALAGATVNVLVEFDITPNPKVAAVLGFVTTASMIYGPKIYMIRERKKEERDEKGQSD